MAQSFILGLGCYLALKNEVTPGLMIAGSILMGRALAPLDMIISTWKLFSAARVSYQRLSDLLSETPPVKRYMTLPPPKGNINVEGIIVQPPGSNTSILKSVNFSVAAGESVGIIGPSASGKSTLARSILGIWQPLVGKVRLDGADINQLNRDEVGQYLGYLPQDIELFDGTVGENIARFGEIVPEKVIKAAQLAGVHEMILNLPAGYDTRIGMGGSVLSGGQRQRIALARALYGDPKIIVLDEPNSNLDDQGEFALAIAINSLKQAGATIFLITHRPAILARMDKILFLKDGMLAAFGPRDAVLQALAAKPAVQQQQPAQKPVLKQVVPH
jgi:ATP-binding cassette subfamily C protein EexD